MRPGKLMALSLDELNALAEVRAAPRGDSSRRRSSATSCRCCSRTTRPALQHAIANLLMKQGLQRFVQETLTPLNRAVGDAWMRGELQVFEEHLYTEQLQVALRTAINAFPRQPGMPRVLLTTFPNEQHGVGLLMVEALLVPEGVQCISLGTQTPLEDIRRAVAAHKVHILALSFSGAFPVAAGHRRPREPAAPDSAAGDDLGGRRDDAPDTQDAARASCSFPISLRPSARCAAGERTGSRRPSGY